MKVLPLVIILSLLLVTSVKAMSDGVRISYPADGEWPTTFVDINGDGVHDLVMEIDPWNVEEAMGTQAMSFDPSTGTITFLSNLTHEVLRDPESWVHGYPEVYFGNKPWNGNSADGFGIELPMRVPELKHFVFHLEYSIEVQDSRLPLNLAMETWLTRDKYRSTGVFPGEAEIMVWFYYQNMNPAGTKIGETNVPVIVNGTLMNATFEVWLDPNMGDGWQYMAFRIENPLPSASLTIDPTLFVKAAEKFTRIELDGLYMEDWETGTEFGGPSTHTARFEWTMRDIHVEYGVLEEWERDKEGKEHHRRSHRATTVPISTGPGLTRIHAIPL